jgi:hypothetical protein
LEDAPLDQQLANDENGGVDKEITPVNLVSESVGLSNFSNPRSFKNGGEPLSRSHRRSRRQKRAEVNLDHSLFEQTKLSTYDEQRASVETVKSITNFKRKAFRPKSPIRCFSFETNRPIASNKNLSCEKLRAMETPIGLKDSSIKNDCKRLETGAEFDRLKSTVL